MSESGVAARQARMAGRTWLVVVVVVAVLASAGGVVASRFIMSPREVAARTEAPEATLITAEVVSQRLENTVITRGDISPNSQINVGYGALVKDAPAGYEDQGPAPGGGEQVLTGVFVEVGDPVEEGAPVVEVAGRPVILLKGKVAMFRDIHPGMEGRDVRQLLKALRRLGYYSGATTQKYGAGAKDALGRLYADLGYPPATTDAGAGEDEDAVRAANDELKTAKRALADLLDARAAAREAAAKAEKAAAKAKKANASADHGGADAAGVAAGSEVAGSGAAADGSGEEAGGPSDSELEAAREAVSRAQDGLGRLAERTGVVAPRAEIVFVPRLPAYVTSIAQDVGYGIPDVLVTVTPSRLLVQAAGIASGKAGLLAEGDQAELELPDGQVVTGQITALGPTPGAGDYTAEIAPDEDLDFTLAGRDIKVTFVAARTPGEVLAVPAGAISSDSAGNLSVIVVGQDNALARVVVATGVSGDDLVEVVPADPASLGPGDKVVIGG